MRDTPYDAYLDCVEDALESTGHPRAREVVDDLRIHLAELRAAAARPHSMADLIEQLGAPEEYVESIGPIRSWLVRATSAPGRECRARRFPSGNDRVVLVAVNALLSVLFLTAILPLFIFMAHGPFEWGSGTGGTPAYVFRTMLIFGPVLWGASHIVTLPVMEMVFRLVRPRSGRMPIYLGTSWCIWIGLMVVGAMGD
ncbi:MAG: hypothetical protein AMXMBFR84_28190 [Candidatus Hydrogenedentota bacterium]